MVDKILKGERAESPEADFVDGKRCPKEYMLTCQSSSPELLEPKASSVFHATPTYTDVYTAYSEHILHFAYDSMTGSYDLPSAFAHVFVHFQGVTNHWMKWREPVATEMIKGHWECSQTTSQKIFCQELTGLKIVGQDWSNKFTLLTFLCFHQFWRNQCSRCKGVQCWRIWFLSSYWCVFISFCLAITFLQILWIVPVRRLWGTGLRWAVRQQHNSCCLCIFDVAIVWFILDPRNHFSWSLFVILLFGPFGAFSVLVPVQTGRFGGTVFGLVMQFDARPARILQIASVLLISHRKVYIIHMIYWKRYEKHVALCSGHDSLPSGSRTVFFCAVS